MAGGADSAGFDLVLNNREARRIMASPAAVAIPYEPPKSIEVARWVFEDFGLRILVAVGDYVYLNLSKYWRRPDLAIVDYATRRSRVEYGVLADEVLRIVNERSTLSYRAFDAVKEAYRKVMLGLRVVVEVQGEEDLLAIPAVLEAPPGTAVLYGLYTGYLILIPINLEYKLLMLKMLSLMDPVWRRGPT